MTNVILSLTRISQENLTHRKKNNNKCQDVIPSTPKKINKKINTIASFGYL